jgi:hypothetical protein
MVIEYLIGKCGIEREYFFDKSMYLEYFHNNGIIEGTLKKYIKVFSDKDNTDYHLSSETPFINGERNGTGIKYNLFDEPYIWSEYENDELKSLKSFYKDRNGNNDYFKFYFNDMMPTKLEIDIFIFDLNFINDTIKFVFDKKHFQIIFNNNTLQFYYNERSGVFDMAEFF